MSHRSSVLVTGASTGIGRAVVDLLTSRGVHVFAAVRDLGTVLQHPLVTGVRLDVTDADDVRSAAATVADHVGEDGLRGLVNNAGVAVSGILEYLDPDELRRQLEVNVVGQLAVTQALLPHLRRSADPARIVFTSSISGRVATPFVGPYAASKHALNALAASLRHELRPWGIGVSTLSPGTVATPIWDKARTDVADAVADLPDEALTLYGDRVHSMRSIIDGAGDGLAPEAVAERAHHALFSPRPRRDYLVGTDARVTAAAAAALPDRAFDAVVDRQFRTP